LTNVTILQPLRNFGANIQIQPTAYYEPRDEQEVLTILNRHRGEQIRAIGRLHSWSEAVSAEGVVLNLRHLQQIEIQSTDNSPSVVVGAGCQLKTLLARLKQQGLTLPSLGLINEQTIAGAISTGTHGSGKHSLSHYVAAVRVARYDSTTGTAIIEQVDDADALRAARCSLGCLGIIVSVTMQCRETYSIEEHLREYHTLDEVLQAQEQYPLQQFFYTPWRWRYMVQHRREVSWRRSGLPRTFRIYWFLSIDLGLHLLILATLRTLGSFRPIQFLFRRVIPRTTIQNWKVTDDSATMLVMEHELFRHLEMELFVSRENLPGALEYVRDVLIVAGKPSADLPPLDLDEQDLKRLESLRGQYGHHYPICVRRVLTDDTLISMASGGTSDWYAISLISYDRPTQRQAFMQVMEFLAATMSRKFDARPHWGKFCPLPAAELIAHYPRFADFQAICEARDGQGVFRNGWIASLFAAGKANRADDRPAEA
jgi:hypothetical protein